MRRHDYKTAFCLKILITEKNEQNKEEKEEN